MADFASACVAGYEAVDRLVDPQRVDALGALAAAGVVGFAATGSPLASARVPAAGFSAQRFEPLIPHILGTARPI